MNEFNEKNIVLIKYLKSKFKDYKIKAEYSTTTENEKLIVVQEKSGEKIVFFDNNNPLYNYYSIDIFANSIKEALETSLKIGNLIGHNDLIKIEKEKSTETWQIMIQQFINPQSIAYEDIRRIGYNLTIQCVVNKIYIKSKE